MKVGVILPTMQNGETVPTWEAIRAFACRAEAVGLDSIWIPDHFFTERADGAPAAAHEAWTLLSALAAATSGIAIGTLVLCTGFRSPGLTAKMAVSADEVAGGRIVLGLGAGWYDREYDAFGVSRNRRVSRFAEALEQTVRLLRGERVSARGEWHALDDAELLPAPGRRIPVLVAAERPRMLALTARHADAWVTAWYGAPDDRARERLAGLDAALAAAGRDPREVERLVGISIRDPDEPRAERSVEAALDGPVEEVAGTLRAYGALGFDHAVVLLEPMTLKSVDRLEQIVRAARA